MKYPKRSQYRYAEAPYRIRNWPEYEAGLRRRGDPTTAEHAADPTCCVDCLEHTAVTVVLTARSLLSAKLKAVQVGPAHPSSTPRARATRQNPEETAARSTARRMPSLP